ncbi:hypothetical protein BC835DRAFT_1305515 [Cytidiella melzeri]|nr:hypothetical protein BC835DRAFT_1305515 [Cytidiella melzeri]
MSHFPNEILEVILSNVDILDLIRCRQVDRRLRSLVDESILLQLQIECALTNLVPTNSPKFTSAELLQAVREYQTAWRTLSWTNNFAFDSASVLRPLWATGIINVITGGILAQSGPKPGEILAFTRVPSKLRNIPQQHWSTPPLGFTPESCVIDVGQDLLVVLEAVSMTLRPTRIVMRLHPLSLSTGLRHPASSGPTIAVTTMPITPTSISLDLVISGDHVGQIIRTKRPSYHVIRVLNWRTGLEKLELTAARDISRKWRLAAQIHRILVPLIRPHDRVCELGVIEITDDHRQGSYDELAEARFCLPSMANDELTSCVQCEVVATANTSHRPAPDIDVPFYHTDKSRVLMICMCFMYFNPSLNANSNSARECRYRLFVHADTIDRMCREATIPKRLEGSAIPSFDWPTWADHVRLVLEEYDSQYIGEESHSRFRFVQRVGDGMPRQRYVAIIHDFLPAMALRRNLHLFAAVDQSPDEPVCRYHLEPEVLEGGGVWQEEVVSKLPYCEIISKHEFDGSTVCALSEDAIINLYNTGRKTEMWSI